MNTPTQTTVLASLLSATPICLDDCPKCRTRMQFGPVLCIGLVVICPCCGYARDKQDEPLCACLEYAGDNPHCPTHGGQR